MSWSAQDQLQIRGRVHRPPQKKIVRCYYILADETADIILAALAQGKHHMMAGFLTQDRGKGLFFLLHSFYIPGLLMHSCIEMFTLLSGKNIADPNDDYDENDPKYMREEPSVVKAKSKKSKGKQSATGNEGGQQQKKGKNKSAAVVVDSDDDAARKDTQKDVQSVEGKKGQKGKKGAENETVIDVDAMATPLGDNPPTAASVSAPAPADTGSTPIIIPTSASASAPAAATALNARDGPSTTPTTLSWARQQNASFASSPNEVQDILMDDDNLDIGFTVESSSRLEGNDMSSPISKVHLRKYTIYLLTSTGSFIAGPKQLF